MSQFIDGSDEGLEERLRIIRIVVLAMAMGIVLFSVVTIVLTTLLGSGPVDPISPLGSATFYVALLAAVAVVQLIVAPLAAGRAGGVESGVLVWQRSVIVLAAIREFAGLVGIVLAFMGGEPLWILAFACLSLAAISLGWPRPDEAHRAARADDRGARRDR